MPDGNKYGIWVGDNATVAVTEKLMIAFLRLRKDNIVSILRHKDEGVVAVVNGMAFGTGRRGKCDVALKDTVGQELIDLHSKDRMVGDGDSLVYEMHDGTRFATVLAEKIELSDDFTPPERNLNLSIAERMELWNLGSYFILEDEQVSAGINAHRYCICYNLTADGSFIYCRVGLNGYCDKGYAMLSTVCLRANEVRMVEDNLATINEYRPVPEWFALDSCSFPADGGWYWSVKEATDDYITLHGCEGATYRIDRFRARDSTTVERIH
jgi:hypothetical protein